jgi:hypothetical protein
MLKAISITNREIPFDKENSIPPDVPPKAFHEQSQEVKIEESLR